MTGRKDFESLMTTSMMANALGADVQDRQYKKGLVDSLQSSISKLRRLQHRASPEVATGVKIAVKSLEDYLRELQTKTLVIPKTPKFSGDAQEIEFPEIKGLEYRIDGQVVSGRLRIKETTDVDAFPKPGYMFLQSAPASWTYLVNT